VNEIDFSQVVLNRLFSRFFTGCDHVKSALFRGFEILNPVKKPVKKLLNNFWELSIFHL